MALAHPHRPFQVLALATLALGPAPALLALSMQDPVALAGAYAAWTLAVYLWASGGAALAATTFGPGEPQRPGWLLLSASYLVLLPGRLLAGATGRGLADLPVRFVDLATLFSTASGLLGVLGFVVLARAWWSAGLDLTSRGSRLAARLVALAVGLLLAGPDLLAQTPAALAGSVSAIGDVVTDLLDITLFVVAVPVLRAALLLRSGLVAWPWLLLTVSLAAWLGFDAAVIWGQAAGLSAREARVLEECMRSLGATAVLAAGVAQRWIMQPPPGAG
jgi:hypothetical protein